jgi:hypothetical protein
MCELFYLEKFIKMDFNLLQKFLLVFVWWDNGFNTETVAFFFWFFKCPNKILFCWTMLEVFEKQQQKLMKQGSIQ